MKANTLHSPIGSASGYTLVEALVAGIVLMIGISAASALTLALLTQDEMSARTTSALSYQESVANLYRLGLSDNEIEDVLPETPVIDKLTISHGTETVTHTPALASVPDYTIPYADITVEFSPSGATQSWTGHIWTGGAKGESRSVTIRAYKSAMSSTIN